MKTTPNSSASAPARVSETLGSPLRARLGRPSALFLALIAAIAFSSATIERAAAQTGAAPGADMQPVVEAVLLVSMERILRDSLAGRSIRQQAETLRDAFRTDREIRREALRDEERALAEQRRQIDRAEFATRVTAFEDKVRSLRRDEQDDGARLQRAVARAHGELEKALAPILFAIMAERAAGVMLNSDEKAVVLFASGLDVTEEAIKRLDEVVPSLEVRLPEAEGE